jgi:hypothetical protein
VSPLHTQHQQRRERQRDSTENHRRTHAPRW